MKKWELPRRTVLKGMGACLALPLLDAMMPSVARAAALRPPKLLMMCFTNGIYTGKFPFDTGPEYGAWTPAQFGKLPAQLPEILQPLNRHVSSLSVLSGINSTSEAGHVAPATYLTCQFPENTKTLSPRDSMDQIVANELAATYKFPFKSIATCPWLIDSSSDDWFPGYGTNLSYWNKKFVDKYSNPLLLYDLLFKNFTQPTPSPMVRSEFNQSVLDYTKESLSALMRPGRLGREDVNRMKQFMDSVRDLEVSLAALPPSPTLVNSCQLPTRGGQDLIPFDSHEEAAFGKRAEALLALMVHAFACDLTTVGTFLWDEEATHRTLKNVIPASNYMNTVMDGQCHGDMAHYPGVNGIDNTPAVMAHNRNQLISANRYYSSVVANVLDRMKTFVTPEGTLLDSSMVSYGYGLSDANMHSSQNLPLVIAGRGGGLQPGNHYNFKNKTLQSHHLTLMRKMGSMATSFAGTSETLNF